MHEISHTPQQFDHQPERATLGLVRWATVGCVAGLAAGFVGGVIDGWHAWRVMYTVGGEMFAGAYAAPWNFATVVPITLGLTAALIVGAPITKLLTARRVPTRRVRGIGGALVTVAVLALWPLVAAGTSMVTIGTIQWISGVEDSGRNTIAHYFYQFIPTSSAFWGLIESIAFALTLFGLHSAIWHRTDPNDRRGRALRVLLATMASTIVFAAAFALITDQIYIRPEFDVFLR